MAVTLLIRLVGTVVLLLEERVGLVRCRNVVCIVAVLLWIVSLLLLNKGLDLGWTGV